MKFVRHSFRRILPIFTASRPERIRHMPRRAVHLLFMSTHGSGGIAYLVGAFSSFSGKHKDITTESLILFHCVVAFTRPFVLRIHNIIDALGEASASALPVQLTFSLRTRFCLTNCTTHTDLLHSTTGLTILPHWTKEQQHTTELWESSSGSSSPRQNSCGLIQCRMSPLMLLLVTRRRRRPRRALRSVQYIRATQKIFRFPRRFSERMRRTRGSPTHCAMFEVAEGRGAAA